ncbi:ABC transporter substrate-binding protein [Shimwellia blattae]|uniref:High-affinity branched-chain amino acid ABC transporter periplasmic substrate-binding protein n=1 Tax=Shimwellia blattae (strain ATCC 29907 / DSM 4481 / JCM 1650 / NBRC 105725 / CDC 9005-74) TaxID=630626 RepID=I2B8T6_SHIBC|nr:high-affinity branched-chain amino acid ABC transporter periplasmic substrate-binding protein [Shimwellia blattae DSM 4481 = NBRC 105725]GAB82399.1 branched-chain amino acid ABC transporter substrate-binding periplasmic protein [Shimwellia blattae DSM 4481 = NBRC 105725]VDY64433.1 Leucine-, isoleucine-, valine-, threonine-, and alanine-binding protein precursor [Shimwellia blattae]VEC22542.1 Leucine-, isoleucine-, valine-, threonine-, and alanine-binding protein precursor [Shimwellia blattae]
MNSVCGKLSALAVVLCGAMGASTAAAQEIKIGVVLPLSGPLSGYGQPSQKGVELIQSITPTLKNGDTVKLIIIDNKSDKVESANAMQRLVSSDKVDAVIGEVTSTNTLAMTKIADDTKTPLVSPTATNDRVTRNHPYVSRVCFSDSFQGVVGANLASRDLNAKTAAIIFDSSNDYSVGLAKAFRNQFKKNGGVIPIEVQAPAGSKDFKAQLASVKSHNVDMIYMPIYYTEGALIAVQAKQMGLQKPVVGGDGLAADQVFFDVGKDAVNGYMTTDYYSPNAKTQTPAGASFIKAWEDKYKQPTHTWGAMTADAYNVIINAMNQCTDPKDRVCVNEKIRATKDFQGVTGTLTLNNGDAVRSAVINEVQNGKLAFKTVVNP